MTDGHKLFCVSCVGSGAPNFPYNCQVSNMSDSSLAVTCLLDMEKSRNSSWNMDHLLPRGWQDMPRIFVHAATHYFCEVYHSASSQLLANASTDIASSFLRHDGNYDLRISCRLHVILLMYSGIFLPLLLSSQNIYLVVTDYQILVVYTSLHPTCHQKQMCASKCLQKIPEAEVITCGSEHKHCQHLIIWLRIRIF